MTCRPRSRLTPLLSLPFLLGASCRNDSPGAPHVITLPESSPPQRHAPLPRKRPLPSPIVPTRSARPSAPSKASLATLEAGLSADDWMVRHLAMSAVACLPGAHALPWLERGLADVEEDIRAQAIEGLARRPEAAARALLQSVEEDQDEHLSLRVLAAASLVSPPSRCP